MSIRKMIIKVNNRFPARSMLCRILVLLILMQAVMPSRATLAALPLWQELYLRYSVANHAGNGEGNAKSIDISLSANKTISSTANNSNPSKNINSNILIPLNSAFTNPTLNTKNNIPNVAAMPYLQLAGDAVVSKTAVSLNGGKVEGSVRQLQSGSINDNGAIITSDLLVPGSPNININGSITYNGTVQGSGSTSPSGYSISLNGGSKLRHVVTRTDAISIDNVPGPPNPSGNNNVVVNQPNPTINFSTLRDLTLNSNVGDVAVSPGTYGNFSANSGTALIFGDAQNAGTTIYNLQGLTLNSSSQLKIVGSVELRIKSNFNIGSQTTLGVANSPLSLVIKVASGNINFNSNSALYGILKAPNSTVSVNNQSIVKGSIVCNQFILNSGGLVQWLEADTQAPVVTITSPQENAVITQNSVVVSGSVNDASIITGVTVNGVNATLNGTNFTATVPLTLGANTITVIATDFFGNSGQTVRHVTYSTGTNQAPTVNAGADQTITLPNNAALTGTATDDGLPNGTLTLTWSKVSGPGNVTFSNPNATSTLANFSVDGTYVLRLTANDSDLSAMDDLQVVVNPVPPTNQAPVVNAGPDQTITLPASATLNGSASDDNLPNNTLTVTWSSVSGPGTVTFTNANQASTTASFSIAGTYSLRLTASDSALTSSDDCVITVNPVPPTNQAPVVNAGEDQSLNFEESLLKNGGNEADLVSGEIANWTEVNSNNWTQASASQNGFPIAQEGNTYFYAGETASAELKQDIDVSLFADAIDANTQQFSFRGFLRVAEETVPDTAQIIVEYRNADNSSVLDTYDSGALSSPTEWMRVADLRVAPVGTRWIRIRLIGQRNSGTTLDAYFDGLTLRPVAKAWTTLLGTISDDGLPVGSSLSSSWSKVSGPGNVIFATPTQANSRVSFDAAGTYVLRLTATDSVLTSNDEITISITSNNQTPTVNAGIDQSVTLPNSINLAGVVSDDGLPAGGTFSVLWSKVSGEGTVTFSNSNAATTTATFSTAGVYVLKLAATDGSLTTTDEIIITVSAAQQNQAPIVNAGEDITVTLPNSANLQGSVTDDGLPQGSTLSITWNKVDGPGDVTFANVNAATTTATFSVAGTYILRLSANDTQLTTSDDLIVTVAPSIQNHAPIVNAGENQTITLPQSTVTLTGSVSDDGLPQGSHLTVTWTKVSGRGDVVFENPNSAITTATFSTNGVYVLRLTATDSALSSSSDVTITVDPEPVLMIYSTPYGFEPAQIEIQPGIKKVMIRNRTGLDNLTYKLTSSSTATEIMVNSSRGDDTFIEFDFPLGEVVLTEVNNPDWICRFIVVPEE